MGLTERQAVDKESWEHAPGSRRNNELHSRHLELLREAKEGYEASVVKRLTQYQRQLIADEIAERGIDNWVKGE